MEESDDDLVWTDATDPPSDSDTSRTSRMSEKSEASCLERKYKKELCEESCMEPQLENGYGSSHKKKKKCKHKNSVIVKSEPESDLDCVKKKTKSERNSLHIDESQNSTSVDNSYLELKVKEEDRTSLTSLHKKQKKHKKVRKDSSSCNDTIHTLSIGDSDSEQKKPKKKKHKHKNLDEAKYEIVQEVFSAEETVVGTCNIEDGDVDNQHDDHALTKKSKKTKKYESFASTELDSEVNEEQIDDAIQSKVQQNSRIKDPSSTLTSAQTRHSRISDRILFEDDSHEESIQHKNKVPSPVSYKLQQFVKSRGNLQPSKMNHSLDLSFSKDDEVIILDCPSEVEIASLVNITVPFDKDCKLKLGGHKYEGHIYLNGDTTPLLLFNKNNNHFIQSFLCKGKINLRKRLPKAHFVTDNIIENERNKFIPLPETKCRHPLFGPDYKKVIKIPSAVRERLQAATASLPTETKKKKKKKKEKVEDEGYDGRAREISQTKRSGKRARRDSSNEEPASKRAAWDDERAIEHNLFQF